MIKRTVTIQEQRERMRIANIERCAEQGRISINNAHEYLMLLSERLVELEHDHHLNPGNWAYLGEIQDIEQHLARLIPLEMPEDEEATPCDAF